MKPFNWRALIGIVLVVIGGLSFLQGFNVIHLHGDIWGMSFAVLFAAIGAAFLYVMASNRLNWWAAIPGFALLGLAALILLAMVPGFPGVYGGAIFMASISLGFLVVYLMDRRNWWAIIPGGSVLSVAVMIALTPFGGNLAVGVMFFGMGVTFAALTLLPVAGTRMSWAWIPALALFLMGVFFLFLQGATAALVAPVALILVGGFLLVRPLLHRD
ncbi:MAG TPA: hypothetical protein VMC62_09785 [Longilinea sp.]|nr:hypothetical protein [Longilinea sp.]